MKHNFQLPPQLSHLKLDERGYPIPFFVPIVDGKPNFRYASGQKLKLCVERKLCAICGKKLFEYSYLISGPIGMRNRVSTDGPMHRECAEFALAVCPHLFYKDAERKENETGVQTHVLLHKPDHMMLIKCNTKFKWKKEDEGIFGYQYVSHEVYEYIDGRLQKSKT